MMSAWDCPADADREIKKRRKAMKKAARKFKRMAASMRSSADAAFDTVGYPQYDHGCGWAFRRGVFGESGKVADELRDVFRAVHRLGENARKCKSKSKARLADGFKDGFVYLLFGHVDGHGGPLWCGVGTGIVGESP